MSARVRCPDCRATVAVVTARLFEWPRYAAGLLDEAAAVHAQGCHAGAMRDIRRIWGVAA